MHYVFKIMAGHHFMARKGKSNITINTGKIFRSNHELDKKFANKFQRLETVDGDCVEGEICENFIIAGKVEASSAEIINAAKEKKELERQLAVAKSEAQEAQAKLKANEEANEEQTDDNPINDSDVSDADDDSSDEDDSEDTDDDSDDDEEVEFTLPMKLIQLANKRKFDVEDANGVKVNDKALSRKMANSLIKSYKEA